MCLKRALTLSLFLTFVSCSTIDKKDCSKDMKELGMAHGRSGSPKKFTDELRKVCSPKNPSIDLESYEIGFSKGWLEYCLPTRSFEMGKKNDSYVSFCPPEREDMFREKYLIGKRYFELKDTEEDVVDELERLKLTMNEEPSDLEEHKILTKELEALRREIQKVELEGKKDTFMFVNPL
jgi:hypothetical protein